MINFLIISLLIAVPLLLLINKNPAFFFWLFLMLFFDPGGFMQGYFVTFVDPTDVLFLLILVTIFSVNKKGELLRNDNEFKKIFIYLLLFQIYYIVIYGYLVPSFHNRLDFLFFLQKNRMYFMALPIMYGVYLFSLRSIEKFFKMLVYFSIIVLSLYLITLLTGLPIVPTMTMERYQGSGIVRLSMLSYGLIHWILPSAIIVFFIKRQKKINISNEKIINISAFLMLVTYLLTLTRREYLSIALSVVLIILLVSYVYRASKLKLSAKIIVPSFVGILLFFILFPQSLGNVFDVFLDTFSLVFTGQDTRGVSDYRLSGTGDLEYAKQIIAENLIMGTGYIPYMWADVVRLKSFGDTFAMAMDASAEVPIYGAFFRLGIVGVLFASGIYILLLKNALRLTKNLKLNRDKIFSLNHYELIILFLSLYLVFTIFTIRIYALFGDFYSPSTIPVFGVVLGLFYSLKRKWEIR